jgi:hypothetical protein
VTRLEALRDALVSQERQASRGVTGNTDRVASLSDASKAPAEEPFKGFTCPPCGRFIRTEVNGEIIRSRTGSPPRFCSPGCRQAAYRRRRAGARESERLQHNGGRNRSLSPAENAGPPASLTEPSPAGKLTKTKAAKTNRRAAPLGQ